VIAVKCPTLAAARSHLMSAEKLYLFFIACTETVRTQFAMLLRRSTYGLAFALRRLAHSTYSKHLNPKGTDNTKGNTMTTFRVMICDNFVDVEADSEDAAEAIVVQRVKDLPHGDTDSPMHLITWEIDTPPKTM
jgi:hypothetical protein